MKSKIFNFLKFIIGWPLSLLALFFIVKLTIPQLPTLLTQINKISILNLFFAFICFFIYYFIRGYIWKRMIKLSGHEISYKDANFIWAASEIQRYIPGNIWSFLGRAIMFSERGINKKVFAKYSIMEIQLLIISSITVSLLSIPFLIKYFSLDLPYYFMVIFAVGAILMFLFKNPLHSDIKESLYLLFLNLFMFLTFGFGYFLTFVSFFPISPALTFDLIGFSVLSFIIGYLSLLTPSGFGVREGAIIFGLNKIMPIAAASFLALFSRFILIIAEVIFVFVSYIWYKKF